MPNYKVTKTFLTTQHIEQHIEQHIDKQSVGIFLNGYGDEHKVFLW